MLTARSTTGSMMTDTVAELSPGVGSAWSLLMLAVVENVPTPSA
jgi:hypothetical protein